MFTVQAGITVNRKGRHAETCHFVMAVEASRVSETAEIPYAVEMINGLFC